MVNPYDNIVNNNNEVPPDFQTIEVIVEKNISQIQQSFHKIFESYLSDNAIESKSDNSKNLWEQGGKYRSFKFNKEELPQFFSMYEKARKDGYVGSLTEYQNEATSCIMIDFDLYQNESTEIITNIHIQKFLHAYIKYAQEIIDIDHVKIYSIWTKRNEVTYDEKRKKYRHGVHGYIYIKISRQAKRYILKLLTDNNVIEHIFKDSFQDTYEEILDYACCYVPTLLYGSKKKISSKAYDIWIVFTIDIEYGSIMIIEDKWFADSSDKLNFAHEMSLNYDGQVIKKTHYDVRESKKIEVESFSLKANKIKTVNVDDIDDNLDDLNQLTVADPDIKYLKDILDILAPFRYNNRIYWFKVVYILVTHSKKYLTLAKWFSQKSPFYDTVGFEAAVEDSITGKQYALSINNIFYWAKQDNPDEFNKLNNKSCFRRMCEFVFDPILQGYLSHAHFAEVMESFIKNIYVTDIHLGKRVWYEFKFPSSKMKKGQVWKWIEIKETDSLDTYIHRKLHNLCIRISDYITNKIQTCKDKILLKYYQKILNNFKSRARQLGNDGFKAGIIRQIEKMIVNPGFRDALDDRALCIGIGNGILELHPKGGPPNIVSKYNSKNISKYTNTIFKLLSPKDPTVRKILLALRSMHLDNESDVFEFLMMYKASAIDNRSKPAAAVNIGGNGGNGKTFSSELFQNTMGSDYTSIQKFGTLLKGKMNNPEGPSAFLMTLENARSAWFDEGPKKAYIDTAMFKRITGCSSLAVRALNSDAQRGGIKINLLSFIISNFPIIFDEQSDAIYRRFYYIFISMSFKKPHQYEADNPYHRLRDSSLNKEFNTRDDVKTAFLFILVFFHCKLMWKYDGNFENVPHPTVIKMTNEFRSEQDTINNFINQRMVKTKDNIEPQSLNTIVELYCEWYDNTIQQMRHFKRDIIREFSESAIKDYFDRKKHGTYLDVNYRFLSFNQNPEPGELMYQDFISKIDDNNNVEKPFPDETPEQYLDRFEKEWNELQEYWKTFETEVKEDVSPYNKTFNNSDKTPVSYVINEKKIKDIANVENNNDNDDNCCEISDDEISQIQDYFI